MIKSYKYNLEYIQSMFKNSNNGVTAYGWFFVNNLFV